MEQYYYLDANNQQKGPVGVAELISAGVRQNTLIWKKGMTNWEPAISVPEVAELFVDEVKTETPPPPAATPSPQTRSYSQTTPRSYSSSPRPIPNMANKPDNYLIWSILTTVLCCLPFGIAAIVYSTKVDSQWNLGNVEGAKEAAKQAKTFAWISFGAGIAFYMIYVFAFGIGMLQSL